MTTLEINNILENIERVFNFFENDLKDMTQITTFINTQLVIIKSYIKLDILNKDYKITNQHYLLERHIIREDIRYFFKYKELKDLDTLDFIKNLNYNLNRFIIRFLLIITQN